MLPYMAKGTLQMDFQDLEITDLPTGATTITGGLTRGRQEVREETHAMLVALKMGTKNGG